MPHAAMAPPVAAHHCVAQHPLLHLPTHPAGGGTPPISYSFIPPSRGRGGHPAAGINRGARNHQPLPALANPAVRAPTPVPGGQRNPRGVPPGAHDSARGVARGRARATHGGRGSGDRRRRAAHAPAPAPGTNRPPSQLLLPPPFAAPCGPVTAPVVLGPYPPGRPAVLVWHPAVPGREGGNAWVAMPRDGGCDEGMRRRKFVPRPVVGDSVDALVGRGSPLEMRLRKSRREGRMGKERA